MTAPVHMHIPQRSGKEISTNIQYLVFLVFHRGIKAI